MSKPYYRYKTMMGLERAIYDEQCSFIEKEFGKKYEANCNLGWGVDANETQISVATKVYKGDGRVVVTNASLGDCRNDFRTHVEDY